MNVCILNTSKFGGGAEAISRTLYEEMMQFDNCNVFFVSGNGPLEDENCIFPNARVRDIRNIRLKIKMAFRKNVFMYLYRGELRHEKYALNWLIRFIKKNKIDILHINNIHGAFLGIYDVKRLSKYCKIVWTMHDMWVMTGHCVHAFECDKWIEGDCSKCPRPQLMCKIKGNVSGRSLADKKKCLTNADIHFVAISEWMQDNFRKSVLKDEDVSLIPNGIDTKAFTEKSRDEIRKKWVISDLETVVLFVANGVDSPYKGLDVLLEALSKVEYDDRKEITLLICGKVEDESIFDKIDGYRVIFAGYVENIDKMSELYSAADVFVAPSRAESFSLVVVESLSCGTPVIGSSAGGIPEIITEEVGWIFENGNSVELFSILLKVFQERRLLTAMREKCRARALEYDKQKFVNSYRKLYERIIT